MVHIIQETIDWIKKNFIPLVDNAKDIKELMAYEGGGVDAFLFRF